MSDCRAPSRVEDTIVDGQLHYIHHLIRFPALLPEAHHADTESVQLHVHFLVDLRRLSESELVQARNLAPPIPRDCLLG